eukprot:scaffold10467_cov88-Isochrysis_galbana.AAC.1
MVSMALRSRPRLSGAFAAPTASSSDLGLTIAGSGLMHLGTRFDFVDFCFRTILCRAAGRDSGPGVDGRECIQ